MQRWEDLQDDFDALGVKMVAISPNTVEQADAMRSKHGLSMLQLADPDLEVIKAYGVEHPNAMAGDPRDSRGMRRALAIPTTILTDASGTIRWIDQSSDYRVRSDGQRVLKAVKKALK